MAAEVKESGTSLKAIGAFIRDLVAVIAGLLAISGLSTIAGVFAFLSNHPTIAVVLLAVSGASFTGVAVPILILRYIHATSAKPSKWLLRGYKLLEVSYKYEIHDLDLINHSQTTKTTLKALEPGIELFEHRYTWTGKGNQEEPHVKSQGHQIIGFVRHAQQATWRHFYVYLGHELNKHEEATIEVVQAFRDTGREFLPFLSKVIVEPTDSLVLQVILPEGMQAINVYFTEWESTLPGCKMVKQEQITFTRPTREISWKPQKLVHGHNYVISWNYYPPPRTQAKLLPNQQPPLPQQMGY